MANYKVYKMYSPYLPFHRQRPQLLFGVEEEIEEYTAGAIDEEMFSMYVLRKKEVKVIAERQYSISDRMGITEILKIHSSNVKIIYTHYDAQLVYFKCDELYLRGYYLTIHNLALASSQGYEPINHHSGAQNCYAVYHNKRKLVIRSPLAINNKFRNVMGYVDLNFINEEQMLDDIANPFRLNLKPFIQDFLQL